MNQLDGVKETPLLLLRPWLKDKKELLARHRAAETILERYLVAADRFYGSLPVSLDPCDRRQIAKRLLSLSHDPKFNGAIDAMGPQKHQRSKITTLVARTS